MNWRARIKPGVPETQQPATRTQAPGEIEMDLNGDGVVDELESQNQAGVPETQQPATGTQVLEKLKWT